MYAVDTESFLTDTNKFADPNRQFWTLQIGGWIGYCVVVFFAIIHPQFEQAEFNLTGQLINLVIETFSGFVLSSLLWFMIRRIVHLSLRLTLFISFTSAALLGCVLNVIKLASYKSIIHNQVWYLELDMLEFGGWLLFSVATMYVFTAIFFIMLYNSRLQKEHEMLLRAQTSAKESQLQMLRYQLNPHFMFNTLNAISTLILKQENDKANDMLDKLCEFFRYSLSQQGVQQSTLKDELALLDVYLSIEKVRFGERLSVTFDIDTRAQQAKVPSLFLQPIIENAIKYGVEANKNNGQIHIVATCQNEQLVIQVADSGPGLAPSNSQGFGIGLNNTKERLNTMFNSTCDVELGKHEAGGAQVTIKMPFQVDSSHDR